jgi:phosphoglycolate phosphatase-like HAD superfamily hydrolase
MGKSKVVIFDFDGTLADVALIIRKLYDEESKKRGWPELNEEEYLRLRKGSVRDVLSWVGIRPWQLPGLLRMGRSRFYELSKDVELFDGIEEIIRKLHEDKWHIYVLSSNSARTIREVLHRHGVDHYVHILRRPSLFGKATSIRSLIHRRGYSRDSVWMIGDEVRDIEAANTAGVRSIGVAWGLQDESALKRVKPTKVARTPDDIYSILTKGN